MIVAVLGGTLASLLAAIVSAWRISFAMGRDGVFPRWFGVVNARVPRPVERHYVVGLLNVVFLWACADRFDRQGAGRHHRCARA